MSTNKQCTNCPGATDHDTAHCPLRATNDLASNRFEVPVVGWTEQAEGAQGEREACSECSGTGKVYDVSGEGPWNCYACTDNPEVIGYANSDELDNMLDDRTAVLSPVKTGFHTVPMYRKARAALAQPSPVPVGNLELARTLFEEMALIADDEKCIHMLAGALAQPSPAPELPERGTQHRFSTTEQTCRHDFAGVWWNDNGVTKTGRECRNCGFFREYADDELGELEERPLAEPENEASDADRAGAADVAGGNAVVGALAALTPELERPDVVATLFVPNEKADGDFKPFSVIGDCQKDGGEFYEPSKLMTVAQYDRIVGELRAELADIIERYDNLRTCQDGLVARVCGERDAAQARVAELEPSHEMYAAAQTIHIEGYDGEQITLNTSEIRKLWRAMNGAQPFPTLEFGSQEHPVATVSAYYGWKIHNVIDAYLPVGTKLYAAPVARAGQVPEASEQEKEQGWTLDYRFVERVTDLAASRTEYTTSMEATEQVLLAARELLAAAPAQGE